MSKKKFKISLWWILPLGFVVVIIILAIQGKEEILGVEKISSQGNSHLDSVDAPHQPYNSNPPTSGPHIGQIAPWGVSKEIIPDELQVHNLEDGGVVIQYNPDKAPKEIIERLESMASLDKHVLVAPRYEMDHVVAITAWNKLLAMDSLDEERILNFIKKYAGIDHHVTH